MDSVGRQKYLVDLSGVCVKDLLTTIFGFVVDIGLLFAVVFRISGDALAVVGLGPLEVVGRRGTPEAVSSLCVKDCFHHHLLFCGQHQVAAPRRRILYFT